MKNLYTAPTAEAISIAVTDIITTSITEDTGDNDGDWTGFVFNRNKAIGKWE